MTNWLNDNSDAVIAFAAVASMIGTLALVAVTTMYVVFTARMVREMERSRQDAYRPVIGIRYVSGGIVGVEYSPITCQLSNVGQGPALDVTLCPAEDQSDLYAIPQSRNIGLFPSGFQEQGTWDLVMELTSPSQDPGMGRHLVGVRYRDVFGNNWITELVLKEKNVLHPSAGLISGPQIVRRND